MTSSLQQGIDAAKSGMMEQALVHLKDAIVEEPENANVWVWLAAIIEDEEKQTIFLKKALEIDPANRPAQRGLAFIERKKYIPPKPGEKLSDYTKRLAFLRPPHRLQQTSLPLPRQIALRLNRSLLPSALNRLPHRSQLLRLPHAAPGWTFCFMA
jgi:tetratricopeptide (TPR) repeat protein